MKEKENLTCVAEEAPFFINKKYVGINFLKLLLDDNKIEYYTEEEVIDYKGEEIIIMKIYINKEVLSTLNPELMWEITEAIFFIRNSYKKNLEELSYYLKVQKLPWLDKKRLLRLLDFENSSLNELEYRKFLLDYEIIEISNVIEKSNETARKIRENTYENDENIKKLIASFIYNITIKIPVHNVKVFLFNQLRKDLAEYQADIQRIENKYPHIFN